MRFHSYPSSGNDQRGLVRVSFTIGRNGQIISSRISPSGVPAFDAKALSMIRQAAPFPPFPPEIRNSSMDFTIPVDFTVR